MAPVIIYCCTGMMHLVFCVWSVRSLKAFGYDSIEIVVRHEREKAFIESHLDQVSCEVISVDIGKYNLWAFRPFVLEKYQIKHSDRDIVICDADVIWKRDPEPLFNRFRGEWWIHKITSLNPSDLNRVDISEKNIGLRTMVNYKNRVGLNVYPNYHLNCGLFMVSKEIFPTLLKEWVRKIRLLPPEEMIMTEALLSLVYAEMGWTLISDREDIKYLDKQHDAVDVPVASFEVAELPEGMFTGYQTAQHYLSDQKELLTGDAVEMGLDFDHLSAIVEKETARRNRKELIKKIRARLIHELRGLG